jgi:hypothetical protein
MRSLVPLLALVPSVAAASPRDEIPTNITPFELHVVGDTLVWINGGGEVWRVPADFSAAPRQLTLQNAPADAHWVHALTFAHGEWIVGIEKGLARIDLSTGKLTLLPTQLPDSALELVPDGSDVYASVFKHREVVRIAGDGTATTAFEPSAEAMLALANGTMYAASYETGDVIARSMADGKITKLARIGHPIGLAVDDGHVYIRSADDRAIVRIDVATKRVQVIARDLGSYASRIAIDGDWIYFDDWRGGGGNGKPGGHDRLERVRRDGSAPPEVLRSDLAEPQCFEIARDAIYISDRPDNRILRIAKP